MVDRAAIADMARVCCSHRHKCIVFGQDEFNILELVQFFGANLAQKGNHWISDMFFHFCRELKDELVAYIGPLYIKVQLPWLRNMDYSLNDISGYMGHRTWLLSSLDHFIFCHGLSR